MCQGRSMASIVVRAVLWGGVMLLALGCTEDPPAALDAVTAGSTSSSRPPTTTTPATVMTSPATTATTTTPATTITSTTTTTTTMLPSTLDIDGSPLIEFSIEVDPDLATELSEAAFTAFVIETLSDERSWGARGVGFRLVEEGGLFTMTVATPSRVDQLCAPLQTNGFFSCARNGWVAFNSNRWFGATDSWPADLETYRRYLINHEVGHYLLGPSHASCPGQGEPAPVMMQQTKGLGGCVPNGWVEP